MSERAYVRAVVTNRLSPGILQRQCTCGRAKGPTGHCADCGRMSLGIQTKLTVNEPGDRFEQEADRAAEIVMKMEAGQIDNSSHEQLQRQEVSLFGNSTYEQLQRQAEEEEEEEEEKEEEELIQPKEADGQNPRVTGETRSLINGLRGGGRPLPPETRAFFEPRFGYDFSRVRVHTGSRAAQAARSVNARAFTLGRDIVFDARTFSPGSPEGNHLIAHELAHVIQQGGSQDRIARDKGKALEPGAPKRGRRPLIIREEETPDIQRVNGGEEAPAEPAEEPTEEAPPAPAEETPPAPAVPTLNLTPGNSLTRGQTLTAAVNFTPTAGETINVTAWSYNTDDHGDIDRPAGESDFQSRWSGTMALSGTLSMSYQVTPSGGEAGDEQTVDQAITVNDRTGAMWVSKITDESARSFPDQPSPPELFRHLGVHDSMAPTLPDPTETAITAGPNSGLTYVSTLSGGRFISRPKLHPDVTNARSRFRRFHEDPSILWMVADDGSRRRIPNSDYSNLVQDPISFTVPDWEAFYKAHNYYTLTATAGDKTVDIADGWWRLDPNAEDGDIDLTNRPAIRTALGIGADETFETGIVVNGAWQGVELMPSADIETGTRSHEYNHATHSHRANFHAMMRALDPQRKIESTISSTTTPVVFDDEIDGWWDEIIEPDHELVDESASRDQGEFVAIPGQEIADVNEDPDTGNSLGNIWNITGDVPLT